MVEPEFLPPIQMLLEYFQLPGSHSVEHCHQASFNGNAAVLELGVCVEHIQPLRFVLFSERNASTLQRFSLAISGPGPPKILSPRSDCRGVLNRRRLFQPVHSAHINGIGVAVPDQLDGSERVIPAEIHPTNARPMTREITVLDCDLDLLD